MGNKSVFFIKLKKPSDLEAKRLRDHKSSELDPPNFKMMNDVLKRLVENQQSECVTDGND